MKHSFSISRSISLFFLSLTVLLASCSKSKDDNVPPQGAAFIGQYVVVDPSETYTLQIESKGGSNFQIKEFGGHADSLCLRGCVRAVLRPGFADHDGRWQIGFPAHHRRRHRCGCVAGQSHGNQSIPRRLDRAGHRLNRIFKPESHDYV